jgi:hypothetical protein
MCPPGSFVIVVTMTVMVIMSLPMMMFMPMMMIMRMPVMMFVVMAMLMPITMIVLVPMRPIVRLERRRHLGALQPMVCHQCFNLRPFLQPDAVGQDLHRKMAVAESQDEARDGGEVLCPHLDHRLDVGDDLCERAIVEHQEIVGAQARRRRKIELDTRALAAEHKTLLLAAVVEFQQQRIDDLAGGRLTSCRF